MNTTLISLLRDVGIDDKEARVYLAILELGNATVIDISNRSSIKRTTIYFILEKLKSIGMVHEANIDTKTFYTAERPENIIRQYKEKVDQLSSSLNLFQALGRKGIDRSQIHFFDSEEGFKMVWRTLFRSGEKEYLIITDPREMLHFVRKNYITGKIIKEKLELGIKSRQLVAASEYAKEIVVKDKDENRVSKTLPREYPLHYTTIIFGDTVALISPLLENIIMLCKSRAFAGSQRSLFNIVWDSIPEIK